MFRRFVQRQLARFWPLEVIGNPDVGFSAKFPWDKNWCWAAKRETVEFGARQRGRGR
jgi:hypothetical protein